MVNPISGEIGKLNNEIFSFEQGLRSVQFEDCGSDCYCRKAGNHKVTKSQFHKKCITMKKSTASVKKRDLFPAHGQQCSQAKNVNVFDVGRAQVEVTLRSKSSKDKLQSDIACKKIDNDGGKLKKLVDTGSDPIKILKSNKAKKCWSSVLSASTNVNLKRIQSKSEIPFDPPVKLPAYSSSGSSPLNEVKHRAVMVRDRGIQCDNGLEGPSSHLLPSYNPISSLKFLLKDLKRIKRRLNENDDCTTLDSIITDMDFAVDKLAHGSVAYKTSTDGKDKGLSRINPQKEVSNTLRFQPDSYGTLQETCQQLQASCSKLEQTCSKLQKEKDCIMEKFFEKSRELESCLKRELDYQVKLNDAKQSTETMVMKLDRYTKSMEELSSHVSKLQAENVALQTASESTNHLMSRLIDITKENDKLRQQVQLLSLEREKNMVLLDLKEQELGKLKSELRLSGNLVSEKVLETLMAGDTLMMSSGFNLSDSRELAVSSPEGTIKSPSKSWKAVSSILSPNHPHRLELPGHQKMAKSTPLVKAVKERDGSKKNPLESINHMKKELRDLFLEMKQQTELSEGVIKDTSAQSEFSQWSSLTDSSDGYNSITENDMTDNS